MKNILLIVVDCARAETTTAKIDQASALTERSARLPFLERLQQAGTTWPRTLAVSSTTTPNFASLFTGLNPVHHGIRGHSNTVLREDLSTTAELLRQAGYHTAAEMTGPLIPEAGLDRGFQSYRYRPREEYLHAGFLRVLGERMVALPEPWLLCLHLWEAHKPYQNQAPYDGEEFGRTEYDRALSLVDHQLFELYSALDLERTAVIYTGDHGERLPGDYELNQALGGDEMRVLEAMRKFRRSKQSKQMDFEAWFEVASRELGEVRARIYAHNVMGHGFHLTEELTRIPLVIVDAGRFPAGEVRDGLAHQTDLHGTLLDIGGADRGAHFSLDSEIPNDRTVYVEANGSGGKQFASRCFLRGARDGRFKYWKIEGAVVEQRVLWDLEADPREIVNVHDEHPEVAARLDRFVDAALKPDAQQKPAEAVDAERARKIEEKLRELGYL